MRAERVYHYDGLPNELHNIERMYELIIVTKSVLYQFCTASILAMLCCREACLLTYAFCLQSPLGCTRRLFT